MEWTQISTLIVSQIVLTGWTYWMKKCSDADHKKWVEARDEKARNMADYQKKIEWDYVKKRDEIDQKLQEKVGAKIEKVQLSIDVYHGETKTMVEDYLKKIGAKKK